MSQPSQHDAPCYLLTSLPRELRDEIWKLVIDDSTSASIAPPGAYSPQRWLLIDTKNYRRPSLLNVSRQVRIEAGEYYYGEIRLVFHRVEPAFRRLQSLDIASLRQMKMLSFAPSCPPYDIDMVEEVLKKLRRVFTEAGVDVKKVLHVRRRPASNGMPRWVPPDREESLPA